MQGRRLAKTATNDLYAAFLINNIFNYYSNNGDGSFNPLTMIRFILAKPTPLQLKVFNILGQLVATLLDEQKNGGYYQVDRNAAGVASGVYFYRLQAGGFVQTKKMVAVK